MNKSDIDRTVRETSEHIALVREFIEIMIDELESRSKFHDNSKFSDSELPYFAEAVELKNLSLGSKEYEESLKKLGPALEHHYKLNRHHPQHFPDGVNDMNLIDILEMFCDWSASVKRHVDGDLNKSIIINQNRFGISDQLTKIFQNTINLLEYKDK